MTNKDKQDIQCIRLFERYKEAIQDHKMDKEWGTWNCFCKNCYERSGHKITWCHDCGGKIGKYPDEGITWREWIDKAITPEKSNERKAILGFRIGWRNSKIQRLLTDKQKSTINYIL